MQMTADMTALKKTAHEIIDQMPQIYSWDDVIRAFHVRREIEKGIADIEAGRVKTTGEIRAKFGIKQ